MRILLKAWLPILAAFAVAALGYLIVNWPAMTTTHRLSFIGLIMIVAHIHEEERFPGGFGYLTDSAGTDNCRKLPRNG
jgi:hypothetical protein